MALSLRRPANEPEGTFTSAASGTRFTIRSGSKGTWQRMERFGGMAEYQVAYVIGSGRHAAGYLIQVGDHLFQSPICYYTSRKAYDLAPGYERIPEPDFTRPVGEECVLCHSGRPSMFPALRISTSSRVLGRGDFVRALSRRGRRAFEAAGSRLHREPRETGSGGARQYLRAVPSTGISQRILNPGRDFDDFHPGQRLEDVFTVYTRAGREAFKVISHAEQLALSACARGSQGKLWCGTCHDPHPQAMPASET